MKGSFPGRVLWVKIPGRRHDLRPLQVTSQSGGVGGKTLRVDYRALGEAGCCWVSCPGRLVLS